MIVVVRRRHAGRRARGGARRARPAGRAARRAAPSAARWPSATATSAVSATGRCATCCSQARYVSAAGEVVKAGGPTVKNVSGFDLCRLLVGSRGTLGFLGEVILRTRPLPAASQWFTAAAADPFGVVRRAVPPDQRAVGRRDGVGAARGPSRRRRRAGGARSASRPCDGPPPFPTGRRHASRRAAIGRLTGTFVAEVGVGIVHGGAPPRTAVAARCGRGRPADQARVRPDRQAEPRCRASADGVELG